MRKPVHFKTISALLAGFFPLFATASFRCPAPLTRPLCFDFNVAGDRQELLARNNPDFSGTVFYRSSLFGVLPFSTCQYCDFQEARAIGARFSGLDLSHSGFPGIVASHANFQDTQLVSADFTAAKLYQADFRRANLADANFRNADLSLADFRGAKLSGADFGGAFLLGTRFDENVTAKVKDRD